MLVVPCFLVFAGFTCCLFALLFDLLYFSFVPWRVGLFVCVYLFV